MRVSLPIPSEPRIIMPGHAKARDLPGRGGARSQPFPSRSSHAESELRSGIETLVVAGQVELAGLVTSPEQRLASVACIPRCRLAAEPISSIDFVDKKY